MITLYISKLSVGLVLYRLAEARKGIRISLLVSMVALTIWTTVTVLTVSLQCRPLAAAWGEGTGTCVSGTVISNTGYSFSCMDITMSWFYAVRLPTLLVLSSPYADVKVAAARLPAQRYSDQPKAESICHDSPGAWCCVSSNKYHLMPRLGTVYWWLTRFHRSNVATLIRLKYLIDIRYVSSAASSELVKLYLDSYI